jgi:mono/diheme cytochrome c family protein
MEDATVIWRRWAALGLAILALTAGMMSLSCNAAQNAANTAAAVEDPIAHGGRIVYTSGCADCHTPGALYGAPDTTRWLSGSELGWTGPWGTSFPRNLTPDSATGIGAWTEEQIITAVREGRRPDGSPLLPPMPWQVYSHFTDAEVGALAKYLKSIPAVVHDVPKVVPPGKMPNRPALVFPAPPEWDARNLPPPPATASTAK